MNNEKRYVIEDIFIWTMYMLYFLGGYLVGLHDNKDILIVVILFVVIVPLSIWFRHKARTKRRKNERRIKS